MFWFKSLRRNVWREDKRIYKAISEATKKPDCWSVLYRDSSWWTTRIKAIYKKEGHVLFVIEIRLSHLELNSKRKNGDSTFFDEWLHQTKPSDIKKQLELGTISLYFPKRYRIINKATEKNICSLIASKLDEHINKSKDSRFISKYFEHAGFFYPVKIDYEIFELVEDQIKEWLNDNTKDYSYFDDEKGIVWFEDKDEALFFKLTWG